MSEEKAKPVKGRGFKENISPRGRSERTGFPVFAVFLGCQPGERPDERSVQLREGAEASARRSYAANRRDSERSNACGRGPFIEASSRRRWTYIPSGDWRAHSNTSGEHLDLSGKGNEGVSGLCCFPAGRLARLERHLLSCDVED